MLITRSIGCSIAFVSMACSQLAWPVSLIEIDAARIKGLAFLYKSHQGDGTWPAQDSLRAQTTATIIEALANSGIKSGPLYGSASAWLANTETASVDATARKIAALASVGMNMKSQTQALLALKSPSDYLVWGAYPQYGMSFPDTPLSIAAVRLSGYSYTGLSNDLMNTVACEILPSQRADGGWSYTRPVLQETIKHRK